MNIAMWSGPRNLSTAMMYSFAARGDCAAWDEPFYAAYLKMTGIDHPMRDEIIAAHENDPDKVAAMCRGAAPGTATSYSWRLSSRRAPISTDRRTGCQPSSRADRYSR